jgi:hypothetical protein
MEPGQQQFDREVTTTLTTTADPLMFAALSGFDLTTDRDTSTSSPLGINLKTFGVKTATSQHSGSFDTNGTCYMQSDLSLSSQATSCELQYVALTGYSNYVSRLKTQPTTGAVTSTPVDFDAGTTTPTIEGEGDGDPTCGLSTFMIEDVAASFPVSGGTAVSTAIHQHALGFRVTDCDSNLINGMGGLQTKILVSGGVVWNNNTSVHDQSAQFYHLTTAPYSMGENLLVDFASQPSASLTCTPTMVLDGAGLQ